MHIYINYNFPNWNEYINAERTNKYYANNIKQAEKNYIVSTVKEKYTGDYPVTITIKPHFSNRKKDLDNYRYKGLLDGLVGAGVIKNDNLNCIDKIILEPIFDREGGVDIFIDPTKEAE